MTVHAITVDGGDLAVEVFEGATEPVLAIHGISSQRKLWSWLRAEAPDITLVAPDLRGRAGSFDVKGATSMSQHSDDLVAVLDALGLDAVHVCGMSMGGFVAVALADTHRDRVKSLVLVDGGFPMVTPPGLTRDALPIVFKDRLDRLDHAWASIDDYLDFFVANTAPLLDPKDPLLRAYLAHDLRDGRVLLSGDALLSDAADIYFGDEPWQRLDVPVRLVYAEWSGGAGTTPAYPPDAIERYRPTVVSATLIEGVDHAGSIMTPTGARATAKALHEALED
jgi:pimeloyl-ACP methyl ester carboxylesterase